MTSIIFNSIDFRLICQLTATLFVFVVIRLALFLRTRHKRFQLLKYYGIQGPKPRLIDGSLSLFCGERGRYKIDEQLKEEYGSVYGVYFGDHPEITITDLETLRVIMFEKMSSFKERAVVYFTNPLTNSVLFTTFNRWKVLRKVMSASLSAYSMRGQANMEFIEDTIREMLRYIDRRLRVQQSTDGDGKGVDLDILDVMRATALSMISRMAIDLPNVEIREDEPNVKSLNYFLANVTEGAYQMAICFPFLRKPLEFMAGHFEYSKTLGDIRRRLIKSLDEGLEDLSRRKRGLPTKHSTKRPQMTDSLIKLHHEGKITRDEVICNCEAILVAGYDTTSTTLSYIFWALGKHPEIQEKLRHELMAHGTDSEYLEQVINEVMRLYPTSLSFITRLATETVVVNDTTIPSGAVVVYKTWLMHRDPKLWPEPEKFDPNRFRKGVEIHPCAFAPFGMGERKCLGLQLAKLELKMITCDMLMRYRLVTKAPSNLELVAHAMVLSKPADKIIVNVQKL